MQIESLDQLDKLLEEKNDQIYLLEAKIEELENKADYSNWEWMKQFSIPTDDFRKDLPVPRLEMIIEQASDYQSRWMYGLVYMHYSNMITKEKQLSFIPLGHTTTSHNLIEGRLDTPYRDGVHCKSDTLMLGLPCYLTRPSTQDVEQVFFDLTEGQERTIRSFIIK